MLLLEVSDRLGHSSTFCQQSFRQTLLLDLGSARRLALCPVDRFFGVFLVSSPCRSLLSERLSEKKGSEKGHRPKYRLRIPSSRPRRKGAVPRTAHPCCQVYLTLLAIVAPKSSLPSSFSLLLARIVFVQVALCTRYATS